MRGAEDHVLKATERVVLQAGIDRMVARTDSSVGPGQNRPAALNPIERLSILTMGVRLASSSRAALV